MYVVDAFLNAPRLGRSSRPNARLMPTAPQRIVLDRETDLAIKLKRMVP
jgi:hypothetical protein